MANVPFKVADGLTVGNTTIFAGNGDIVTTGNISSLGPNFRLGSSGTTNYINIGEGIGHNGDITIVPYHINGSSANAGSVNIFSASSAPSNGEVNIYSSTESRINLTTQDGYYNGTIFNSYGEYGLLASISDPSLAYVNPTNYIWYYNSGYPDARNAYTYFQVNATEILRLTKNGASIATGNLVIPDTGDVSANIGLLLANAGTQQTSIDSINANIGTFHTYANANIGTLYNGNITTNANLGAFQTYANSKIGTNTNSNLVVMSTQDATSTTNAALVVKGGAGVVGSVYSGTIYPSTIFGSSGNAIVASGNAWIRASGPSNLGVYMGWVPLVTTTFNIWDIGALNNLTPTATNYAIKFSGDGANVFVNGSTSTNLAVGGTSIFGVHSAGGIVNGTLIAGTVNAGTIGNTGAVITGTTSNAAAYTNTAELASTAYVRSQGGFQAQQVFTTAIASNPTWTIPAGVTKVKATVVGGGGAGGGSTLAINGGAGTGGGAGAIGIYYFTGLTPGGTITYNVGAGGAGAAGAAGLPGGASNVAVGGITINAPGGSGGLNGAGSSGTTAAGAGGTIATQSGGTATAFYGAQGAPGGLSVGGSFVGIGGTGYLGAGAAIQRTGVGAGNAGATGTGAGGGGAYGSTAATQAGGAGGSGAVIFEY